MRFRSGDESEQPRKAHRAEIFHIAGRSRPDCGCFGGSSSTKVRIGTQIRAEQAGITPVPGAQICSEQAAVTSVPGAQICSEQAAVTSVPGAQIRSEQAAVTPVPQAARRRACGSRPAHGGKRAFCKADNGTFADRRTHGDNGTFAGGNQKRFSERRRFRERPLQWADSCGGSQRHAH